MKPDITEVIADFIFQADPELRSRLEYQEEALREFTCRDRALGRWVDFNDVNYLFSALALEDRDFAERYPTLSHINGHERQRLIAAIEGHFEKCPHCSLKRGYDLEMDGRIEQACQQNNDFLLRILEQDEANSAEQEGEHRDMQLEPTQQ